MKSYIFSYAANIFARNCNENAKNMHRLLLIKLEQAVAVKQRNNLAHT